MPTNSVTVFSLCSSFLSSRKFQIVFLSVREMWSNILYFHVERTKFFHLLPHVLSLSCGRSDLSDSRVQESLLSMCVSGLSVDLPACWEPVC